jgi:DNA repair exonuclease SbcCD ATPase subunit
MLPSRLVIENFCGHAFSEISFGEFTSAVIIGKGKKNTRSSNGVGKSTLFAAIKYALFNETEFSKLDKIIRHGCELSKITLEFKADDLNEYKITRSRSKTSGSDVRLHKKDNEIWTDITQRKPTETEKEIIKIIKINYKTFCNSVLFSQNDLYGGGIAALTPADRKKALKEALQLGVYYAFEKLAKKKSTDIIKDVDRSKTILSTIGNPQEDVNGIEKQLNEIEKLLKIKNDLANKLENELYDNDKILSNARSNKELLEKQILETASKHKVLQSDIENISASASEHDKKISVFANEGKQLSNEVASLTSKLSSLKSNNNIEQIKRNLSSTLEIIVDKNIQLKNIDIKLKDLAMPLPKDATCKHCRQSITEDHRSSCIQEIKQEIETLSNDKIVLSSNIIDMRKKEAVLTKEKLQHENNEAESIKIRNLIETKSRDIENRRELYAEYSELAEKCKLALKSKIDEINKLKKLYAIHDVEKEILLLNNNIDNNIEKITALSQNLENTTKEISSLSNTMAVLIHNKNQRIQDLTKMETIRSDIRDLETKFSLHQKVVQAFGSAGIPALITHTILDDFQIETNNFLVQLWPGLQSQFSVIKDRTDGDKEDTLDISYMLNGNDLEYAQLSGAQKLIASLSLKLGLAAVIKKRLGTDIKLLLIDEVDQSLDDDMLEAFEDAIKKLQKEFKILVITHNKDMKEKFSHAILVEQDENLVSTAKVVNTW